MITENDIQNYRLAADKAAMNGQGEAARVMRELLDAYEEREKLNESRDDQVTQLEQDVEEIEEERDELRAGLARVRRLCIKVPESEREQRFGEIIVAVDEALA
jgi:hypothetical protein